MAEVVDKDIESAVDDLGLRGRPVCVHSSFRSFGAVNGGPATVVRSLLDAGITVLVPSFSWAAYAHPPADPQQYRRNGLDPSVSFGLDHQRVFSRHSSEIDEDMGAIPRVVLEHPSRRRGEHPLCSFTAVGPLGERLVSTQTATDVFAPLGELVKLNGVVLLMGVGLSSMTLLHLAEQQAGRSPFVRWARSGDGEVIPVAVGGCSAGFGNFEHLLPSEQTRVGHSTWRVFDAAETLQTAFDRIRMDPDITRCDSESCIRCADAVTGGPTLLG